MTAWVSTEWTSRTASRRRPGPAGACGVAVGQGWVGRRRLRQPPRGLGAQAGLDVRRASRRPRSRASPSTMASKSSWCSLALMARSSGLRSTCETVPPVAVGGVPEAVERLDQQRVVRGPVDRRVEAPVGDELRRTWGCSAAASSPRGSPASRRCPACVRRSAASDAASGSRDRRTSSRSRASSALSGATRASRCASSSTRPCCLSRRRASRSGVVLMPICGPGWPG